jgi:hypothetical protein
MKTDQERSKCAMQLADENCAVTADDIQYIHDMVKAAPDIREERVTAAREALACGTLPLRGIDLAHKVLRGMLQE